MTGLKLKIFNLDIILEEISLNFPETPTTPTKEKFDFTKPRATRAFALSKAAATKKLLTSENQNGKKVSETTANSSNYFKRNAVQSRSVRVESKNKGDHLAYITDKKSAANEGGKQNRTTNNDLVSASKKQNSGLKSKVEIKKRFNNERNKSLSTSVNNRRNSSPMAVPKLKTSTSAPENLQIKEFNRKSLIMDEEREEAADTLGKFSNF